MGNVFDNAGVFLIGSLFDIYLFILGLRLLLVWVHADYFNPISQFVINLSQFLIKPLRKIIPNIGPLETSTLFVMIALEILKYFLLLNLMTGMPNFSGLLILSLADGLKLFLNILFYAIIAQVILSWLQPGFSPISRVLNQLTAPLIRPFQRLIPNVSGFDLSPIPALLLLQLLMIMMISPLFAMGTRLAFG